MEALLTMAFSALAEGLKLTNKELLPPLQGRYDKLLARRREEKAKGQLADDREIHAIDAEIKEVFKVMQQELIRALSAKA